MTSKTTAILVFSTALMGGCASTLENNEQVLAPETPPAQVDAQTTGGEAETVKTPDEQNIAPQSEEPAASDSDDKADEASNKSTDETADQEKPVAEATPEKVAPEAKVAVSKAEANAKAKAEIEAEMKAKSDAEKAAKAEKIAKKQAEKEKAAKAKAAKAEKLAVKAKEDTTQNANNVSMGKALNVSSSDLPLTVELWTLREQYNNTAALVLKTPTMQMGERNYFSQISLTLEADQLVIYSSSDIDADLSGIGVKLNGGELIPFDRIEGTNAGILEGDWMNKLAGGGELEIMLGFFPGREATTPLFTRIASVDALSSLVPTYYKLM